MGSAPSVRRLDPAGGPDPVPGGEHRGASSGCVEGKWGAGEEDLACCGEARQDMTQP